MVALLLLALGCGRNHPSERLRHVLSLQDSLVHEAEFAAPRVADPASGKSIFSGVVRRHVPYVSWRRRRMAGDPRKRFAARVSAQGVERYLGRWPTRKAALVAQGRAKLFLGKDPSGPYAREVRSLGPASPADLVLEARSLEKRRTTSRYEGVLWDRKNARWRAEIAIKRRTQFIGYFDSEEEAARAHDRVAIHAKTNARRNFPRGTVAPASLDTVRRECRTVRKSKTSSRYVGVWKDGARHRRPWLASLAIGRKSLAIGRYATELEAAIAHDRAALWYRPKRLLLNFPDRKSPPASIETLGNELLHEVKRTHTSRFIGVHWNGYSFTAVASQGKATKHLGSFDTEEEAAKARDQAALRLQGSRAKLNFDPDTGEELIGRPARRARA